MAGHKIALMFGVVIGLLPLLATSVAGQDKEMGVREKRRNNLNITAISYLKDVMDQYHKSYDVYSDANAAGNHFLMRARINSPGGEKAVPPMNEGYTLKSHSGKTSIRASFRSVGNNWGGWYFMNGVVRGNDNWPRENWGKFPKAGINLKGATKLTFWAKGEKGGERVEFFSLGIGRNHVTGQPEQPYPDSASKASCGYLNLSPEWEQYEIDLSRSDLHYVLGGFGWVTNARENRNRDIVFYLDDIRYNTPRLDEPRFLVSYETINSSNLFDKMMTNVGFTYDNALALLAFLSVGETQRAKLIAEAIVYAQAHDRSFVDGRIRNAYQGGDLTLPQGWMPRGKVGLVRMPGRYEPKKKQWLEDEFQVSTHTGNVAWAMLALLALYEVAGGEQYLTAVTKMGNWIEYCCRDSRGAGGYTGGLAGWESAQSKLLYKSTEHNIDLYPAFQRLYLITGEKHWRERAEHAKSFILSMWDPMEGKFWTGTNNDGITVNKAVIPLDTQTWAVLALKEKGIPYWNALQYAEDHHKVGVGYDFNIKDRDGVWYEGTGQMASAYLEVGKNKKAETIIQFLRASLSPNAGLPAANRDGLTTGFFISEGNPLVYYRRPHIGATAWLVLAENEANPFWIGFVD